MWGFIQSHLKSLKKVQRGPTERGWAKDGGGEEGGGDAEFNKRKILKLDQIIRHQTPQDLTSDNSLW